MLKFINYNIVFQEFPDEISLALNITNCPCHCKGCSEPWLQEDRGVELTEEIIDRLIKEHSYISLIGFMGGDCDHKALINLAKYIHNNYNIKIGFYSGLDKMDEGLAKYIDYYKFGRWIVPEGPKEEWSKKQWGPLTFPNTNQQLMKKINNEWININCKLRENIPENSIYSDRYIIRNKSL